MAEAKQIDVSTHGDTRIIQNPAYPHAGEQHFVPIALNEFEHISCSFPIAAIKDEASGDFLAICLLGFKKGENLYCTEVGGKGAWAAPYVPQEVGRYPFGFQPAAANEDGTPNFMIVLHEDENYLSKSEGQPLFNEDGQESEYYTTVKQRLGAHLQELHHSTAFFKALAEHNLLTPMNLQLTFASGQGHALQGLYTIDRIKLAELSDEALIKLHKRGFSGMAQIVATSLYQLERMVQIHNRKGGDQIVGLKPFKPDA